MALPRNSKKAVEGSRVAEVQGAYIDGDAGVAMARPSKIMKYLGLTWEIVHQGMLLRRSCKLWPGG